jgi:hypothetical protein
MPSQKKTAKNKQRELVERERWKRKKRKQREKRSRRL